MTQTAGRFTKRRRRFDGTGRLPYRANASLLSPGECAFFRALSEAVGQRYAISLKTRLADVVHCPRKLWNSPHGRRISQKHLDFIVYDRSNAEIIAAIELDDRSHDRSDRRERDEFVDRALLAADVVLIRF